jgi:hypothetical protein
MNSTPAILKACRGISAGMYVLLDWEWEAISDFLARKRRVPRLIDPRDQVTIASDWLRRPRADCDQLSKLIGMILDARTPEVWSG